MSLQAVVILRLYCYLTVTVKYFLATVPELSFTLIHTSFVPVPANLIETEVFVPKSCFVVHVEAVEAL